MKLESKIKAIKEPKSYGNLTLNSTDFPGVANLTLGDKQTMTITVDVTALRKPDRWEISENALKPTDIIASIRVMSVDLPSENKKEKK